jgi:membrane associated rhomboid family serine protease
MVKNGVMPIRIIRYIYFPSLAIIIMWLTKIVEYILPTSFVNFGIYPRALEGLKGIFCSPFIHSDFNHLISNTVLFFLLSVAIFYFYRKDAARIILYTWLITGILVWIGARSAWHIGASGLVYAYASFLFFSGILSKERRLIAISLLVIFLYGGMIWGIFPENQNISWESHLFGFVSGFMMAFYIGKPDVTDRGKEADQDNVREFMDMDSTMDDDFDISYHYREEDGD